MLRLGVATLIVAFSSAASSTARAQDPRAQDPPLAVSPPPEAPAEQPAPAAPQPDDTVAACVKAAENAQTERSSHRLRAARERLLACAQASCPMVVRNDCATWLAEVDQLMPSVVIQARDTQGIELVEVRVLVDGELVTSHLDGLAVSVDPGVHLFQFEANGAPPLQQQIVIREGEKGRALPITLSAPLTPPPPPKPQRRIPPATYIFGGMGIAGLAGFTYFGLKGTIEASNLGDEPCAQTKTCSQSQVDAIHRQLVVADVSLGIGLVSLGAALYFYLRDQPSAPSGVKPAVMLAPGYAHVGVEAPW